MDCKSTKRRYREVGQWLLSASILLGWLMGVLFEASPASIALLLAFLAGGVLLNVLKEELPTERQGHLVPLLGGMAGRYTTLLLAI
ncbi:MAG: hypothetical protein M3396_08205 [Actinomycetota bacterium]|nr:hypothetical protein [Actinomycetota bacterium]